MDPSAYYSTQSPITDPGKCVGLLDAVPDDVAGLCRIVQGVSINFYGMSDHKLPVERLPEMDTRYVEKILARIVELDNMDKVAVLTQAGNEAFTQMRAIYEGEIGLKVPRVVKSYSPVGEPSEATLPAVAA